MIFKTKPWKHQQRALEYLYPRNFGALYTTMGSGKTKVFIDLIANRGFTKVLILGTTKACRIWPREFEKHWPTKEIPYNIVDVSKKAGESKAGEILKNCSPRKSGVCTVVVNNYESVWRDPFKKFVLGFGWDCVICDESHRIKTPGSKVSKFLQLLGRRVPHRYLATGTPLAQSPLDIYAQYRFLTPEIFGTRYEDFKYRYANWIPMPGGFEMLNKRDPYKNLDELQEKMFSCAFQTEDLELDLPPIQDILWEYDMPTQTQRYYRELQKEFALELQEGTCTPKNVASMILRLQQLTSGYLPIMTDDMQRKTVEIDTSRKEALKELLEEIPPEEPVVIFAKYTKDIKNIHEVVESMGSTSSELSGKQDTLENWELGRTRVLVVQIASGAEGLDFTRAKYAVYYTNTYALWQYQQSRKRIHRPGQERSTIIYHIVSNMPRTASIDRMILDSLILKQDLIDTLMSTQDV